MVDDKQFLLELARIFEETEREGAEVDAPEGAKTVTLLFSDTLAKDASQRLREIANKIMG